MRKIIISIFLAVLLIPYATAYISSDIYLNQDGSAIFLGRASNPVRIEGIELQNGKLVGVTQELTTKTAEIWTFSISLNDLAELKIFLPENTELRSAINSNLDTTIGIERGIIVVSAAGTNPSISFSYKIIGNKKRDYSVLLIALIAILIVLFSIFLWIKFKRKRSKTQTRTKLKKIRKIDFVKKTLNKREKVIINNLLRLKKAKQSFLQRKTAIPKASFSRHIENLKKKGIITKTGLGKNNIIELKKEML